MANKIGSGITYTPFVSPYNMDFIAKGMEYKQSQHDAAVDKIYASWEAYSALPIDKQVDKDYLQGLLSKSAQKINEQYRDSDLTSSAVQRSIENDINTAANDENVQEAVKNTAIGRRVLKEIDYYKKRKPEEYDPVHAWYATRNYNAWLNDGKVGSSMGAVEYTPYTDIQKSMEADIQSYLDKVPDDSLVQIPDNQGRIYQIKKKERTVADMRNLTAYIFANNPKYAKEVEIRSAYMTATQPGLFEAGNIEEFMKKATSVYDRDIAIYQSNLQTATTDIERKQWNNALQQSIKHRDDYANGLRSAMGGTYNPEAAAAYITRENMINGFANQYAYSKTTEQKILKDEPFWEASRIAMERTKIAENSRQKDLDRANAVKVAETRAAGKNGSSTKSAGDDTTPGQGQGMLTTLRNGEAGVNFNDDVTLSTDQAKELKTEVNNIVNQRAQVLDKEKADIMAEIGKLAEDKDFWSDFNTIAISEEYTDKGLSGADLMMETVLKFSNKYLKRSDGKELNELAERIDLYKQRLKEADKIATQVYSGYEPSKEERDMQYSLYMDTKKNAAGKRKFTFAEGTYTVADLAAICKNGGAAGNKKQFTLNGIKYSAKEIVDATSDIDEGTYQGSGAGLYGLVRSWREPISFFQLNRFMGRSKKGKFFRVGDRTLADSFPPAFVKEGYDYPSTVVDVDKIADFNQQIKDAKTAEEYNNLLNEIDKPGLWSKQVASTDLLNDVLGDAFTAYRATDANFKTKRDEYLKDYELVELQAAEYNKLKAAREGASKDWMQFNNDPSQMNDYQNAMTWNLVKRLDGKIGGMGAIFKDGKIDTSTRAGNLIEAAQKSAVEMGKSNRGLLSLGILGLVGNVFGTNEDRSIVDDTGQAVARGQRIKAAEAIDLQELFRDSDMAVGRSITINKIDKSGDATDNGKNPNNNAIIMNFANQMQQEDSYPNLRKNTGKDVSDEELTSARRSIDASKIQSMSISYDPYDSYVFGNKMYDVSFDMGTGKAVAAADNFRFSFTEDQINKMFEESHISTRLNAQDESLKTENYSRDMKPVYVPSGSNAMESSNISSTTKYTSNSVVVDDMLNNTGVSSVTKSLVEDQNVSNSIKQNASNMIHKYEYYLGGNGECMFNYLQTKVNGTKDGRIMVSFYDRDGNPLGKNGTEMSIELPSDHSELIENKISFLNKSNEPALAVMHVLFSEYANNLNNIKSNSTYANTDFSSYIPDNLKQFMSYFDKINKEKAALQEEE